MQPKTWFKPEVEVALLLTRPKAVTPLGSRFVNCSQCLFKQLIYNHMQSTFWLCKEALCGFYAFSPPILVFDNLYFTSKILMHCEAHKRVRQFYCE